MTGHTLQLSQTSFSLAGKERRNGEAGEGAMGACHEMSTVSVRDVNMSKCEQREEQTRVLLCFVCHSCAGFSLHWVWEWVQVLPDLSKLVKVNLWRWVCLSMSGVNTAVDVLFECCESTVEFLFGESDI